MATSSLIALFISLAVVGGLISAVVFGSLGLGALEFIFGKPRLTILRSRKGHLGFAFKFRFNPAKEPASFTIVKMRLFNAFGTPTQVEITKAIPPQKETFELDLDMGHNMQKILSAKGLESSTIQIELGAEKEGVYFQFDYNGQKLLEKMRHSSQEVSQSEEEKSTFSPFWTKVGESKIADTVPGKGPLLKIAGNPVFADVFNSPVPGQKSAGGASASGGGAVENFPVSKVWIIDGCIVCNACEDIYPEVFDVQTDTCIVRPDAAPGSELLKDGLKVQEAAEACPVEVIKFDRA